MANPYPPNQGMQPMQQQPMQQMQQPPMQQPPRPKPPKQGTSRAVPVVVSAGLAVGVFCGLLFGVGVPDTTASPSTGNNVKAAAPEKETTPTPSSSSTTASKPATTATTAAKPATPLPAAGTNSGAGSATTAAATPAAGSGSATTAAATPAAGSGSGSTTTTTAAATPAAGSGSTTTTTAAAKPGAGSATAAAATPAIKKAKVTVQIKPETIASTAKITIDKTELTGGTMEVELPTSGKKELKIVVKATGYKTLEHKVEVSEGDVMVNLELVKRPPGGGGTGLPRPSTGGGKKKPAGGGLIDI